MAQSIKKKKLKVYQYQRLSLDDVNVLSLLYAPLIGSEALQLYLSLSSLISRNNLTSVEFIHEDFYDILHMSEKVFMNSRIKLEGIGLMESYVDEDDNLSYVLFAPQTANQFVRDGVLGIYLNALIGPENLNRILAYFNCERIDESNGFVNITKNFDEVFETINVEKDKLQEFNLTDNVRAKTINQSKDSFDIDFFLKQINLDFVDFNIEEFKKIIINSASTFGFSMQDMIMLYNQSLGRDMKFSLSTFKRKLRMYYNEANQNKVPYLKPTNESVTTGAYSEATKMFYKLTADELLEHFSIKTSQNIARVAELYNDIPYNRTIVNMMIWTVLNKTGRLAAKGYFEAMYSTMMENNITDEVSAYKYFFEPNEKKEKKVSNYTKKSQNEVSKPKWLDKASEDILKGFEFDEES